MKDIEIGEHTGSVEVYTCSVTDKYEHTHQSYAMVCELLGIMCAVPLEAVHDMLNKHFDEWGNAELVDVLAATLIDAWGSDEPNVVGLNWGWLLDRKLVGEVTVRVSAAPTTLH